ncbi:GtrA family protein [Clostridium sp. JNZ J1-5]
MNTHLQIKKTLLQFISYAVIGGSNFLINIFVLNILSYFTHIYSGPTMIIFDNIAFLIYSVNGYLLNKKFTFKTQGSSYLKYASVLWVSAICLNSTLFTLLTMINIFNLSEVLWLNLSKFIASITIGILTFIVNKLFVFKDKAK